MGNSSSSSSSAPDEGGDGGRRQPEAAPAPAAPPNPSYWAMAKQGYGELVNAIIRPPRAEYSMDDLGPSAFTIAGRAFERSDVQLTNPRGLVLECSHWQPARANRPAPRMPCVIYLHGNSSCRVEATSILACCLSAGITVFSLDMAGSGHSGGEWVSLGHFEKDDLRTVTDHLRSTGGVATIGLWGRSMGAATALLHGPRDPSIAALVLDSSFADLDQLALEMVRATC